VKKRVVLLAVLLLGVLSFAPADAPDEAYITGVVGHAQVYSLSCEARSAADWAAYWGVNINETEFLNGLPRSDNPNEGFVGDPNDSWGYIPPSSYGVHADPIAELLRAYGLDAHADTGLSWEEVQTEVAAGRPVIVWVIGSIWAGTPREYETEDGENVRVANNEHTMILIGYDERVVHLIDALTGATITHTIDNFLTSWGVLDNMAVTGRGSGQNPARQEAEIIKADEDDTYTVLAGDTLNKLAQRLNISWEDLAAWNEISYPYLIYPGQELVTTGESISSPEPISSADTYTVKRGDYLSQIARELELEWEVLAELNELAPPYVLHPDQVLLLPGEENEDAPVEAEAPVAPDTYTAERSESLFALAHFYALDWIRLAGLNNIAFPYLLSPGQTIVLQ
jgi:uncharacterized protein YvpB/LysM repeat protein